MPAALVTLLPIILPYGIQAVTALIGIFSKPTPPTDADWVALGELTKTTARQQMLDTLAKHNIDPASPQGLALLSLVS